MAIKSASDRQKAARAFAAELLIPAAAIREAVAAGEWDQPRRRAQLVAHYGVSPAIAQYQYQNQVAPRNWMSS